MVNESIGCGVLVNIYLSGFAIFSVSVWVRRESIIHHATSLLPDSGSLSTCSTKGRGRGAE